MKGLLSSFVFLVLLQHGVHCFPAEEVAALDKEIESILNNVHQQLQRQESEPNNTYAGLTRVDYSWWWMKRSAEAEKIAEGGPAGVSMQEKEISTIGKREIENKLSVVKQGPFGARPNYDPSAQDINVWAAQDNMISAIKIYFFMYNGKRILRGVDFKTSAFDEYSDPVPGVYTQEGESQELVLQRDEYITSVTGKYTYLNIYNIQFTTNKGNSIGAGLTDDGSSFTASNNGAPLLYVDLYQGHWLYEMKFTFYSYQVGAVAIRDYVVAFAKEIYDALKSDVNLLNDIYLSNQWMFPEISSRFCFEYTMRQNDDAEISCNAEFLINQLNSIRIGVESYKKHLPRELLYSNYDTNKLLDLAREGKALHTSTYQLQLSISQSASITTQLATDLGGYFTKVASFDASIATNDKDYIKSKLGKLRTGYKETKDDVHERLGGILAVAFVAQSAEIVQKSVELSMAIGASANPFNCDPAGCMDRVNSLAESISNLAHVIILLANLRKYINHVQDVKDKLDKNENSKPAKEMERIINSYDTLSEDEQGELAATFIRNYGAYDPAVNAEDLAYGSELLRAVADKACELADDVETAAGLTFSLIQKGKQDCLYIHAEIEKLDVIQQEIYSFQFELVDMFTAIVRANVAKTAASKISAISNTIDLTTAVMAMMQMEVNFQAATHARCLVLEYTGGGKRISDCMSLVYTEYQVTQVLAYTGASVPTSLISREAFLPTVEPDDNTPFINLQDLLNGDIQIINIPPGQKGKDWLIANKWLVAEDIEAHPEYSHYVQAMEVYVPNIKCENNEDASITVESLSGKRTRLFLEEAAATYLRAQTFYTFTYNEYDTATCDDKEYFKARESNAAMTVKDPVQLCMLSRGQAAGDVPEVLPSLVSSWMFKLRKPSTCKLVLKDPSWNPMISVKLDLVEVQISDINECWPDTRCEENQYCRDKVLGYDCVANTG